MLKISEYKLLDYKKWIGKWEPGCSHIFLICFAAKLQQNAGFAVNLQQNLAAFAAAKFFAAIAAEFYNKFMTNASFVQLVLQFCSKTNEENAAEATFLFPNPLPTAKQLRIGAAKLAILHVIVSITTKIC